MIISLTIPRLPSLFPRKASRSKNERNYNSELLARISAAQSLQARSSSIAKEALTSVLIEHPENNQSERLKVACLRDIHLFIKFIILTLVSDDFSVIDEKLLTGLKETYYALEISLSCAITALISLRSSHQLSGSQAEATDKVIDYIIDKLRKE
jgi:allophycocyanin beta subunit